MFKKILFVPVFLFASPLLADEIKNETLKRVDCSKIDLNGDFACSLKELGAFEIRMNQNRDKFTFEFNSKEGIESDAVIADTRLRKYEPNTNRLDEYSAYCTKDNALIINNEVNSSSKGSAKFQLVKKDTLQYVMTDEDGNVEISVKCKRLK